MSTRWLFTAAMTGFVAASIACAASETYVTLYVFRFIQGLFGRAVIPIIFSAAFLMFPARHQLWAMTENFRAFAITSSCFMA